MEQERILALLNSVRDGGVSPEQALLRLKAQPFEDVGYAKIDHHRGLRHGINEVIYGESKTTEQIAGIIAAMVGRGQKNILVTRLTAEKAGELKKIKIKTADDFLYSIIEAGIFNLVILKRKNLEELKDVAAFSVKQLAL